MKPLTIPKDTSVYLGSPAKPIPQGLSDAIGDTVRSIAGIREAYLPQCYVKGIVEPPAQILVLVLDGSADHQSILDSVGQGLTRVLPQGVHLDVWPLTDGHSLLDTVRGTRTHIHCSPPSEKKPWWRILG
ncbi:MAG: enhanced serine sensitivity protein SseB C-terminal domain-containing protein [Terriglobales bacterium]